MFGINSSANRSLHYFNKAADKNNEWAFYNLGMLFLRKQMNRAISYFEQAAHQYNHSAIRKVG